MRAPYLYPDSEVLKNLADIQDEQKLKDMEADYTLCFDIKRDAGLVLSEMNAFHWRSAEFNQVVEKFGDCMARLWKVKWIRYKVKTTK